MYIIEKLHGSICTLYTYRCDHILVHTINDMFETNVVGAAKHLYYLVSLLLTLRIF